MNRTLTAPELFARSLGSKCFGRDECHWCGAPCERLFVHDGPPQIPFVRNDPTSKRPANHYVCNGCRYFRRPRQTVRFLNGKDLKDGQCMMNWSVFITDGGCWGIRPDDYGIVHERLLHPPLRFVLSLISGEQKNYLQLAFVNDFDSIRAATPLRFTFNNIPHTYSVYELKEAIQTQNANGKEPGVRILLDLLGWPPVEKRGRGRPRKEEENEPDRIVTKLAPIRKSA